MNIEYDDNYPTCKDTFVTLRIFSDVIVPSEITSALGIEPSFVQVKGELRNRDNPESIINKTNGWFLSSEKNVKSKDMRRHLSWLLAKLTKKKEALDKLVAKAAALDIFCLWESAENQGGPTMAPEQMKILGDLNIELGFEFWYDKD